MIQQYTAYRDSLRSKGRNRLKVKDGIRYSMQILAKRQQE